MLSRGWRISTSIGLSVPVLCGLAALGVYLARLLVDAGGTDLESSVTLVSLFFLGSVVGGFGLYLVLSPSGSLQLSAGRLPSTAIFYGAFAVAVLAGTAALSLDAISVIVFPPFYVVAAVAPSLGVLALTARLISKSHPEDGADSVREMGASPASDSLLPVAGSLLIGTYVAVPLALVVELVIGIVLFIVVLAAMVSGNELLPEALSGLRGGAASLDQLAGLLQSPAVVAAVLILFAVVAPITEELAKSLGVVLTKSYRSAPRALVAGVAAGAGFSMFESALYLSLSLTAWPAVALMRVPTVFMHTLGGGLMGLGWFAALQRKRVSRFFLSFAGATGVHGLWNAATVTMVVLGLGATGLPQGGAAATGEELAVIGVFLLMGALALTAIVTLVLLARRVNTWQS
ncbi:MAG: PrsW family glutamic-type intramembrane protease [Chloroflexi bacterium]|nr:PrsW family glutamic-type intramembrane protease [Chloroflexota bacterium]